MFNSVLALIVIGTIFIVVELTVDIVAGPGHNRRHCSLKEHTN